MRIHVSPWLLLLLAALTASVILTSAKDCRRSLCSKKIRTKCIKYLKVCTPSCLAKKSKKAAETKKDNVIAEVKGSPKEEAEIKKDNVTAEVKGSPKEEAGTKTDHVTAEAMGGPNEGAGIKKDNVTDSSAASCEDILHEAKIRNSKVGDGIYNILMGSQKMKVYCDMTRDGGGWTLISTTRTPYGWNKTTIYQRNLEDPSLSHDYSILGKADQIKSHANGSTFQYRIEVNGRGRWGGIWKAPVSYSFTSTNDGQTNVNLVKKFDDWQYSGNLGIQKRMPWISLNHCCSLLTVRRNNGGHWWGTMVLNNTPYDGVNVMRFNVAPWIYKQVYKGNEFYYWLREN